MRERTFGLHKMLGKYRVAAQLVASRVALSSIELVSSEITWPLRMHEEVGMRRCCWTGNVTDTENLGDLDIDGEMLRKYCTIIWSRWRWLTMSGTQFTS
jgi:hypothetical protein